MIKGPTLVADLLNGDIELVAGILLVLLAEAFEFGSGRF